MARKPKNKPSRQNNESQKNLPTTNGRRQNDKLDPEAAEKVEKYLKEADIPDDIRKLLETLPFADKVRIIAEKSISYSSPYPPPEIYQQYPIEVQNAILTRTGKEQDHRHEMDKGMLKISQDDQALKKRGQTIGAVLIPVIIIMLFCYAHFNLNPEDQLSAFQYMLKFIYIVVGIFVTGRIVTGIENYFGRKDKD